MRTGDESRHTESPWTTSPTYIHGIWNFSTNHFATNINLWWMVSLWEKEGVVCTKFLLILTLYANGEAAWDCLRWLCRPDLLKWELKSHFKGLLSHILFASAQAHCPHAGRLRLWEGVVWFHETCYCQCRWRNATRSEFMVPATPSSACHVSTHSCMLIFGFLFQKERKWNLQAKYCLTFFQSTHGIFFSSRYLPIHWKFHSLTFFSPFEKGGGNDSVVNRDGHGADIFPDWLLGLSFIEQQLEVLRVLKGSKDFPQRP